ncbi:MAG: DUF2283 domain-containing protein [Candidatus Bathyarchaeia archaeon]
MEKEAVKVWFDREGDMLEVQLGKPRKGYFKDAGDDAFLRVDTKGNIVGFALLNVSKREKKTEEFELPIKASFSAVTT